MIYEINFATGYIFEMYETANICTNESNGDNRVLAFL